MKTKFSLITICFILVFGLCSCNNAVERTQLKNWKNGLNNADITLFYKEAINDAKTITTSKDIAIGYLEYDFNDDGMNDYLVMIASSLHTGSGGNYTSILLKTNNGYSEISMPVLRSNMNDKDIVEDSYFIAEDTKTDGLYDLTFQNNEGKIYLKYNKGGYVPVAK